MGLESQEEWASEDGALMLEIPIHKGTTVRALGFRVQGKGTIGKGFRV